MPFPTALLPAIGRAASGLTKIANSQLGTLTIAAVGPNNVSYFHTPDIPPNKDIFFFGDRKGFSYTKFRIRLLLWSAYKIRVHSIQTYALHVGLKPEWWTELHRVDLPVQEHDIRPTLRRFEEENSKEHVGGGVTLDNGTENIGLEIEKNGSAEILVVRIGQFPKTLSDDGRVIDGANYCDLLIVLHVNAVTQIAILCSLPEFHNDEKNMPIIGGIKRFRRNSKSEFFEWADKNRLKVFHRNAPHSRSLRLRVR